MPAHWNNNPYVDVTPIGHIIPSPSQEEFEDTKGVIIIRKLKMDRQHNG